MTIVFWQVVVGLIEGDDRDRYILYQAAIYRVGLRLACFNFEVNFKSRNEFCQKEMWVSESAPGTLFTYTLRTQATQGLDREDEKSFAETKSGVAPTQQKSV